MVLPSEDSKVASDSSVAVPAKIEMPKHLVKTLEISPLEHLIMRAAQDETIDLARMERLIEMRNKERDEARRQAYYSALAEAESEMRTVGTNKDNSQTRSKYASYDAIDKKLRPIYTKHGFALSFNTKRSGEASVLILCTVTHRDGHTEQYEIEMPADGKGAKGGDVMTKTHATGAAVTYGMRYLLKMIFNVSTGDEDDDDGNLNGRPTIAISAEQIDHINKLLVESGCAPDKFFAKMGILRTEDLTVDRVDVAVSALYKFKEKRQQAEAKPKEAAAA